MATNWTHGGFEGILAVANPEVRLICEALRRLITSLHEDVVEVVWPKQKIVSFGIGPRKMTEHYAYIAVQNAHVNLGFYRGASLSDPQHLLEGTGKQLRHLKLRNVSATKRVAVASLLRGAITERIGAARATDRA
jgi:hypothetical protein